jgi:hypothetical protein
MEIIRNDDVVLQCEGSSLLNGFSLKFGEAVFIIVPPPQNEKVEFISNNKNLFYCPKEPCWVKFVSYNTNKKDIRLINDNIDLFKKQGIFQFCPVKISQKDIDKLDGGDIRLMNILLCRLKNENFIELNLIGLADDSIERVINYIIYDISCHRVAYVIIMYMYADIEIKNFNPIFVSSKNIYDLLNIINKLRPEGNHGDW